MQAIYPDRRELRVPLPHRCRQFILIDVIDADTGIPATGIVDSVISSVLRGTGNNYLLSRNESTRLDAVVDDSLIH